MARVEVKTLSDAFRLIGKRVTLVSPPLPEETMETLRDVMVTSCGVSLNGTWLGFGWSAGFALVPACQVFIDFARAPGAITTVFDLHGSRCDACNGQGQVPLFISMAKCEACDGTGVQP